jgi:multidrug efflux pump subunit AcrB
MYLFLQNIRYTLVPTIVVPVALLGTFGVMLAAGFSINVLTMFGMVLAIGILVDDAIVIVENIVRHARMASNHGRPLAAVAIEAVDEVGNPTILATFTVVAAILPMAFVGGLMGPYMRPIPIGATAAMLFSLLVAFIVTPWASMRVLRPLAHHGGDQQEDRATLLYRRFMNTLIHQGSARVGFLTLVVVLLLGACSLVYFQFVKVKMLPFDNKSEFQVIIDMPEGTTLEQTARVARELAEKTFEQPEVVNLQTYAGTAAPYNFNGLVRHYYMRRGSNVADIQVNLLGKGERSASSHEIAKRVRASLQATANAHGARIKVAEVPPGPPVLETLVAEVYGPDATGRRELAAKILHLFDTTPGIVDADWYVEDPQPKQIWHVDRDKAALAGVSVESIASTLQAASGGATAGLMHIEQEREDIPITVRLDRATRGNLAKLEQLKAPGANGLVALSELVHVQNATVEPNIYHKNLMPVIYVTADVAGAMESPVYAILKTAPEISKLAVPGGYEVKQYTASQPFEDSHYAMKWDGEWHITYEVFRDLGIAFAAVLILIYVLVVGWFQSFSTPLVIMAAIPFSLAGILPAHGMLNAFFTATSMIGFIAGAGIVVRNSIILVDFIELRLNQGMPLDQAVVDAGAVRFRPMMLTAAAVVVGSIVILFDPIFQGLAIALLAGEIASLLLSRVAVPVIYYIVHAIATSRRQGGGIA